MILIQGMKLVTFTHMPLFPVEVTEILDEDFSQEVTEILSRMEKGSDSGTTKLLQILYQELRALAGSYFRRENADHTLQPTALVHEVFIKLTGARGATWESRAHFFAVAAKAMRQVLANHAQAKRASKRGGGQHRVTLSGVATPSGSESEIDFTHLDAALSKLAKLSLQQAQIVEMRFLANLGEREIAHVLGIGLRTVQREWHMARLFLEAELRGYGLS